MNDNFLDHLFGAFEHLSRAGKTARNDQQRNPRSERGAPAPEAGKRSRSFGEAPAGNSMPKALKKSKCCTAGR